MTLPTGSRIGPYEIVAPIGAGGMGEVYRARDSRLDRDVAIKILPDAFAADAERLARFEREAKTLAALNHPNIASIYGIEQNALVMELVEGEDLSQRIARGPVPIAETLELARQMADALAAAHERGIIHRDLKPANIKVRPDGTLKVLDFGLAKALDAAARDFTHGSTDLMNSPTITSPAIPGTLMGMIIGTAAYMAPEQAKGRAIDRRADVWAFGVVLFEMLTGKRVFDGADITEVLASVIKDAPSYDALPPDTPPAIRRLLRRCLEKNPSKRLDSMAVARLEIDDAIAAEAGGTAALAAPAARAGYALWTVVAVALVVAAVAIAAAIAAWRRPEATVPVTRVMFDTGVPAAMYVPFGPALALSPDGRTMVFAAQAADAVRRLYVRRFDSLEAVPLAGTEDAVDPFFSPDGRWIGFFASSKLRKIALSGGATVDLAPSQVARGAAWAEDGTIYYTPNATSGTGLLRLPAGGGTPQPLGAMIGGHVTQRWPQVLPGGKALIYTGHTTVDSFEDASLVVHPLDGGQPRELMKGGYHWRYLPSGHIVYVHAGTLFAVPFDLDRLEITGTAVPVLDKLMSSPISGGAQFTFAANGAMVYVRGGLQSLGSTLSWVDLSGKRTSVKELRDNWTSLAISPDGTRVAIDRITGQEQSEIWVMDLARDTEARLTINQVPDLNPVWTPDGKRLVFASAAQGPPNLFWQPADGSAPAERLTRSDGSQLPWSWHPDGKRLVFSGGAGAQDLFVLTFPDKTITPLTQTPNNEAQGMVSPDGKWLAYTSDESGQFEVYVRPFPSGTGRWLVSSGTAAWPIWSRTSSVLYYATLSAGLMKVQYEASGSVFQARRPEPVLTGPLASRGVSYAWALHPDGRRFLATMPAPSRDGARDETVLILGFFDDLKARVKR